MIADSVEMTALTDSSCEIQTKEQPGLVDSVLEPNFINKNQSQMN